MNGKTEKNERGKKVGKGEGGKWGVFNFKKRRGGLGIGNGDELDRRGFDEAVVPKITGTTIHGNGKLFFAFSVINLQHY